MEYPKASQGQRHRIYQEELDFCTPTFSPSSHLNNHQTLPISTKAMSTNMERHYPSEDWPEVVPRNLNSRYPEVLSLVDDSGRGTYTLLVNKGTAKLCVRKTLKKVLRSDESPDRWRREVEVIRELRHENIQVYRLACLCLIQGDI